MGEHEQEERLRDLQNSLRERRFEIQEDKRVGQTGDYQVGKMITYCNIAPVKRNEISFVKNKKEWRRTQEIAYHFHCPPLTFSDILPPLRIVHTRISCKACFIKRSFTSFDQHISLLIRLKHSLFVVL